MSASPDLFPQTQAPALRTSASVIGGKLVTRCAVDGCDNPATFGTGASLLAYLRAEGQSPDRRRRHLGTWWCAEHFPRDLPAQNGAA